MRITNVEFKAAVTSLKSRAKVCRRHGLTKLRSGIQTDIYFRIPRGRLKIRTGQGPHPILVFYERPDRRSARQSRWSAATYSDANSEGFGTTLISVLSDALGQRSRVVKHRTVFGDGVVIVNLDSVRYLGRFVEVEVNAGRAGGIARARTLAKAWANRLGISDRDIQSASYGELLEGAK